ncbi:MAG: peptidase [Lachnospiraceae bacterium]|nr:peptidase [Lachnospiraceae bacterium]
MYEKKVKRRRPVSSRNIRIGILLILALVMAGILIQRLFVLQIIRGEDYLDNFALSIRKTRTIPSTRGEIYDCNGELLAYNRLSYVVTFENSGSYQNRHIQNLTLNSILYRTVKIIESHGDKVYLDFKVRPAGEDHWEYSATGFTLSRFKADLFGQSYIDDLTEEQMNMTADDLMTLLGSSRYFGLDDDQITAKEYRDYALPASYTQEERLILTGLRSALAANNYQRYNAITVAKDVCEETVSQIMENTASLPGVDIAEDYLRVYNNAQYFGQIIGYTGPVSAEELKELQETNSAYNAGDIVGKVGMEQVMESSLQGQKGQKIIYVDSLGRTLSTETKVEPQAGDSLYLTLDTELQKVAYHILEQYIAGIVWSNTVDTDSINTEWIERSDDVRIPVYDVYFALFENNVLDVEHLSEPDASANEKRVYELFVQKLNAIFAEIKQQLTTPDPTAYKDLTEEFQVYQSYIVNNMLIESGILNKEAIDESDLTWIAWSQDEVISLQEFLTYAISKNWIDINGIAENTAYMDSTEAYSALSDYIQAYLFDDTQFCKKVFRYMLKEGSLTGTEVCLLLYDQGILDMNVDDYNLLSGGEISAYDFIRDKIYNLEITPGQLALTPCSGAIVITDPATGNVKVCVSYPGYDNNRLVNEMDSAYYNKLVTDLSSPFYSRATQEVLAPGSTFKIVAATAGVMENQVAIDEGIACTGKFDLVEPPINCWNEWGHGAETLTTAIRDSCNYYFNTIGFRLSMDNGEYNDDQGIAQLKKYGSMYGLDAKSGVEVPETAPHFATYAAVPAAMGQSNHAFTVTQLARYVNTIANSGNCYDLTLIDRITDSNGNVIDDKEPELHSTVDIPETLWSAIHAGMRAMVQQHEVFQNYMDVSVAGKTGTAQQVTTIPSHAEFIGYAPYENPTMAIAVRVANGYNSKNAAAIARDTISYFFGQKSEAEVITGHAVEVSSDNTRTD